MLSNALSLLPFQFQNKENWTSYLTAIISPLDQINQTYQNNIIFDVENSTGSQLDMCGNIIGLARNSLNDANYKTALKQQILLNTTNGTAESFISSIKILLNPIQFYYFNNYGNIVCYVNLNSAISNQIHKQILSIAPVGFGVYIYYTIKGEIVINNNLIRVLTTVSSNNSNQPLLVDNNNEIVLLDTAEVKDISKANFTQAFAVSNGTPLKFSNGLCFLVSYFCNIVN